MAVEKHGAFIHATLTGTEYITYASSHLNVNVACSYIHNNYVSTNSPHKVAVTLFW